MLLRKNPPTPKNSHKLFKAYQFIQLISDPTRIVERSSTLIDLIFTTDSEKIVDSGVIECSISDHSLVYIVRKAKAPSGPIKTINCRSYTKTIRLKISLEICMKHPGILLIHP